jgi:excisionase family DNA binding protein
MTTNFKPILKLYTVDELTSLLSVSKPTVYRLIETRQMPSYKIKGCVRVSHNDVINYLEKNRLE